MAPVLKTGIPERVSGVRIPSSPPFILLVLPGNKWKLPGAKRGTRLNCSTLLCFIAFLCFIPLSIVSASAQQDEATRRLALDIYKQLIEINTTDSVGSVTAASEVMAKRFRDAGFPESDISVLGPNDRKKNIVVRLHGSGKHKPVLLIGHLDVVEARREDWTTDPFQLVEKDKYYYGRGTTDMKDGDAIMSATLIRMKKEGYVPSRDIILAMTADEEGGTSNGVDWLIKNHRDLIDAEFVLNHDGGGVCLVHCQAPFMAVDAAEKVYADFLLTATNPGGHSSLPVPDNAIYELAAALMRISQFQFPFELNNTTRTYYEEQAGSEKGQRAADTQAILKNPADLEAVARLSKDSTDNSTLHTTCVATRLNGGHANNALPQTAQANVNCRVLPGHSLEEIRLELEKVVADPKIKVQFRETSGALADHAPDQRGFAPPPPRKEVFDPLNQVVGEMWPGTPVVIDMATGASDGKYTNAAGMPTYAISGVVYDRDDIRAHGKDERERVDWFIGGVDFYYRFLKGVTAK
jgi:acetylornithine deacetylase/succinyl-diaminopimelate desuccinylase-like protein